jgi:hypothetical protein
MLLRALLACFLVFALGTGAAPGAGAQPVSSTDWAWTPLLEHEGVDFSFIFYREADNLHNGVVIKLVNTNAYAVDYRFKVVFKPAEGVGEHVEQVEGRLKAHEARTGDTAGLFWVPFKDGRDIAQVGLRGYKVRRAAAGEAGPG